MHQYLGLLYTQVQVYTIAYLQLWTGHLYYSTLITITSVLTCYLVLHNISMVCSTKVLCHKTCFLENC